MVEKDVIRAINHEIFNHLRGNTEGSILTVVMENDNIRVGRALRSDVFPYVTFEIRPFIDPLMPVLGTGTLEIHLWDKKDKIDRIYEMRDKVIKLLDLHEFVLGDQEAKGVRTFFDSSDMIEEEEEFIQHMVLLFTCKYIRKTNITV